jgi:hypothetical protein
MFTERIKQLREERQMYQRQSIEAFEFDTETYCKNRRLIFRSLQGNKSSYRMQRNCIPIWEILRCMEGSLVFNLQLI